VLPLGASDPLHDADDHPAGLFRCLEPGGDGGVERDGQPEGGIEITFVYRVPVRQHLEVDFAATMELPICSMRNRAKEPGSLPVGLVRQ